jgi:hypothetical protein
MGIRSWLGRRFGAPEGDDRPPRRSVLTTLLGRDAPGGRSLGEFDRASYPADLREALARREDVAAELREMDLTSRAARVEAIPRLRDLLGRYPHPLAYEALIQAYIDDGRWDEARGAAFAARERRKQVAGSTFPEIRLEVDRLPGWTPQEIEELRREREADAASSD